MIQNKDFIKIQIIWNNDISNYQSIKFIYKLINRYQLYRLLFFHLQYFELQYRN